MSSVFIAILLISMVVSAVGHHKIAAFNIQTFGKSKMNKPNVVNVIKQIILRYDIILVQEIRDSSGYSVQDLNDILNTQEQFNYTLSPRLGRSSYKEQYAYFYRSDRVHLLKTHLFNDYAAADVFEREPYCALFEIPEPKPWRLALVGLHSKPQDAVEEIDYLDEVGIEVESIFDTKDILFMGDMNAACRYASAGDLSETEVFSDPSYSVLIGRKHDTTTKSTSCAYDRIIAKGKQLKCSVVSAYVFNFQDAYSLSQELTEAVSDHFPVELTLN